MKNNLKLLISLAMFIITSLFSINMIYKTIKLDKDTIIDTYNSQLINSIHTINLKQLNNQDLFNILDSLNKSNKEAIKTLRRAKFLYINNSIDINKIDTLINQYKNLNEATKYAKKYLLNNKISYYHTFNSIITNIVNELNSPILCFETEVFNSIINNLGITNVLDISIENLDYNNKLNDNYKIVVKSIFTIRWSTSTSISSLKFDAFNSINNIIVKYPNKSINYEFKFISPTLDINGNLPLEDYINLKYDYIANQNTDFFKEIFEGNYNLWIAS